ncbi:MAG: hypothetical protein ACXAC7_12880 [Candidatus Hodarchaeales archaeon]|jgi:hypothetical protein
MSRHIKENFPQSEVFSTGNVDHNAPMLVKNKRMGYKTVISGK